jgi:hypothetical protein
VSITFHHPGAHHVRVYDPISNTSVRTHWVQSGSDAVASGPEVSISSAPLFITMECEWVLTKDGVGWKSSNQRDFRAPKKVNVTRRTLFETA